MALTPDADTSGCRDTAMTLRGAADSAPQGKFPVPEINSAPPPPKPPRNLRRLLLASHSRGAMLHWIGLLVTTERREEIQAAKKSGGGQ